MRAPMREAPLALPGTAAVATGSTQSASNSINDLPFCRNWNTAVATSTLSGFLSGCHPRNNFFQFANLASFGSFLHSINFWSTSAFALSTSLEAATPTSFCRSASWSLLLTELELFFRFLLLRLSDDSVLEELFFLFFFFFRFEWLLLPPA